jgi:hypothetical protein
MKKTENQPNQKMLHAGREHETKWENPGAGKFY